MCVGGVLSDTAYHIFKTITKGRGILHLSKIMELINYMGKSYPTRTFNVMVEGNQRQYKIATDSLYEALNKDVFGAEENKIDNQIYYYVEEGVIEMDAELICKDFLDVEMKFISEQKLHSTDYVIYDEANDNVLQDSYGRVIIFGDNQEATEDLYGNECVMKCTDLPKHWQETILNQIQKI